jgi:hypothetical protein
VKHRQSDEPVIVGLTCAMMPGLSSRSSRENAISLEAFAAAQLHDATLLRHGTTQ